MLVDPTFGYTTHGASADDTGGTLTRIWFKAFSTPASSGTMDSITCYCSGAGSTHLDPALYSDVAAVPSVRLAYLDTGGTSVTSLAEYATTAAGTLAYASITTSTQYWPGIATEDGNLTWRYDAGTNELKFRDSGLGSWEAVAVVTGTASERGTVFVTYTASGGSCVPMLMLLGVGACS